MPGGSIPLTLFGKGPESFLGAAESGPGAAGFARLPGRQRCHAPNAGDRAQPVEIAAIYLKNQAVGTICRTEGRLGKTAFLADFTGLSHLDVSRLQNRERPLVSRGFAVPRRTLPYLLNMASVTKTFVRRRALSAAGQGKIVTQDRFQVLRSEMVAPAA